jgi:plastocyanin
MKPSWFGALLALLILGIGFLSLSCKDDNPAGPGPGGGADVTINIIADAGSGAFGATPTTVTVGQKVAWKNNQGTTHTSTADGGLWNTGNIAAGATSAPITMNTAGTFPYHCIIHTSMTGSLVVNP